MPTDVLMPQLSPTMTEGRFAKWLKKEGDKVSVGDMIAEIETDKATMEVEATEDGVLAKTYAKDGEDIAVGAPIAVITEEGEDLPKDYKPESQAAETSDGDGDKSEEGTQDDKTDEKPEDKQKPEPSEKESASEKTASQPPSGQDAAPVAAPQSSSSNTSSSRIKASPVARRLATEYGIPLENVQASGPHGRIVKEDVEKARAAGVRKVTGTPPKPAAGGGGKTSGLKPFADDLTEELVPHTKMRTVIAERLVEAKQQVPHFYLTVDVQMDEALKARQALNDLGGGAYKVSVNDMIVKASALALRQHPDANASWTNEGTQKHGSADISVAVATKAGLITPILKNAEDRHVTELSNEMKELAQKAQAGKLQPEEYQGGTFSVSNLGMYGIKNFDAIINPPQSCILACGAAENRPVVAADGNIKATSVMTVTMSVDHRVVDGALGAELLGSIKNFLENPISLVV